MKTLVKPALLSVSALALLAVGGSRAAAQAPSVLQPKGGWSVTKMEATSNGAGPYCALARQYEKDIIFTLGRNLTDEYSLAVDFQKTQMNPEKAYKLTLSPGAGQQRAFNLMPLSDRAMVIRLGWDESFFKALESSRTLRVGIGDVDYSFNMPDIAGGQKDLQNCIDGLKSASAQTAPQDVAPASGPGDLLNAEASAKAGFSARRGIDDENKGAKPVVAAKEEPRKDDKNAHAVIEMAEAVPAPSVTPLPPTAGPLNPIPGADGNHALLKQIADLRAENDRLAKTADNQRKKLEESYQNAKDSNAMAEMQEKLRVLENENKRLTGAPVTPAAAAPMATAPLKTDTAALDAMRAELNKALAEKAKLETDMTALRKQAEAPKPAPAPAVTADADKKEIEKANARYAEAEREVKRLGKQLEDERKAKATPVAAKAAEPDAKQAQELATLKNRFVESERDRETLRDENLKLAADLKKAQDAKQPRTSVDTTAQLKKAQDERAALEDEVKRLRAVVALDAYRGAPAKEAKDQTAAALNAMTPAAGDEPPPLQSGAAPVKAAAGGKGYAEADVKNLLSRANLHLEGGMRRMADGIYGWRTGMLAGRAEVSPAKDFTRQVDEFIGKAKSQCKGDFAAIPATKAAGSANIEIACVSDAGGMSSSVAFFETDGSFVAIAHETAAENMELAMDARDQIARAR